MDKITSIKDMRTHLENHFRYHTMNSWNGSQSFAANVKVHRLPWDGKMPNEVYDFTNPDLGAYRGVEKLIREFTEKMGGAYTIGFNGRSSGYMVLYQSEYKDTGHKSYCPDCGQLNYQTVEPGKVAMCGRCKECERENLEKPNMVLSVWSGRSYGDDIEAMEECDIEAIYDIVFEFDQTVAACIKSFMDYVKSHKTVEQEILVPKKVKIAVEA